MSTRTAFMSTRTAVLSLLFLTILFQDTSAQSSQQSTRFSVSGIVFGVPAMADSANAEGARMQPQGERRGGGAGGGRAAEGARRGEPLEGVNVALLSAVDSTLITGAISGQQGVFAIPRIVPGSYLLVASYIGYAQTVRSIQVVDNDLTTIFIRLVEDPLQLAEVQITGLVPRVEVRGDTTAFNADAYQVNPDASAEELVRRMPGFSIENGRVSAQGEDVRRVLVDGEEFFGDDALVALRNLPAEIIQQVQLFDRQSDQSAFTGFDDGNAARTLNIVTRTGRGNGQFGRGGVSAGTNNRYMASGNINSFNGVRRISVLGLSNNINQQNFSGEDLSGVAEASQQSGGGRPGMPGGGRGGWGGNNNTRNFLSSANNGINTTNSLGINYIDRWGQQTRINSSYFLTTGNNTTNTDIERVFLSEAQDNQSYLETLESSSDATTHRFNARIEHTINRRNSLVFTPSANIQLGTDNQNLAGETLLNSNLMVNQLNDLSRGESMNMNLNGNVLWRHSFPTRGRTFSANIGTRFSDQSTDENQRVETTFFSTEAPVLFGDNTLQLADRQTQTLGRTTNASLNLQYTEPLTETTQLQFTLAPAYEVGESRRDPYLLDPITGLYSVPDLAQINFFNEQVFTNRTGVGYRKRGEKYNFNANADYQLTVQQADRVRPAGDDVSRTYHLLLPSAGFRYSFSGSQNIFVNYRMSARNPSASQLQDVPNSTNPLQVTSGNSNLDQQLSQSITARFRSANTDAGTAMFAFVSASYNTDVIGNNTFVAMRDTVLSNGIVLGRGARYTRPENVGSSYSMRTFANYSMPVKRISSNINFFSGASYSVQPTVNNDQRSDTQNTSVNAGSSLTSNISPRVEFTVSYRATYSFLDNASVDQLNTNYYTGNGTFRLNLLPWGRLLISSDLNITHYEGISGELAENSYFWSSAIGYKFLKDNAAEIRLSVVDMLGQNRSLNRSVSDDFYQDVRSNVISRFALLTFSYNFRRFGA